MDLTESYKRIVPDDVQARYSFMEVRNAAAVLQSTSPEHFDEIMDVLRGFTLTGELLLKPGGNKSKIARNLDEAFRVRGWREARVDVTYDNRLVISPWLDGGETGYTEKSSKVDNEGYKVDNFKDRIALDIEWNAKDGNLDRDLSAYRMLFDLGFIDCAVMITRLGNEIADLARQLTLQRDPGFDLRGKFSTTTTTNFTKLQPRMTRGDAGGCPLLAVAISPATWDGSSA